MKTLNKRYDPEKLPVLETFYSVQGEGIKTGKSAFFVRIGGCDLGCRWCDSKETWDWVPDEWTPVDWLLKEIKASGADSVLVTGGEPLIYDFSLFTSECRKRGLKLYLETSGAHKLTGEWDWICLSPKPWKLPYENFYSLANELKIIIYKKEDFEWAENQADQVGKHCDLLLQPEWSRFKDTAKWVVDYVKKNQKWRISVQIHKFLKIP